MKNISDNSLAYHHNYIEKILVLQKNKNILEEITRDGLLDYSKYIDIKNFSSFFGYKPGGDRSYREMEAAERFVRASKRYFNVDLLILNNQQILEFFKLYLQHFPNIYSYSTLNLEGWTKRVLSDRKRDLEKLQKIMELSKN